MIFRLRSSAMTDTGPRRTHNEDAFVNRPDLGIWAVADGAGGHQAGEVASGMIVEALGTITPGLNAADALAEIRARIDGVHRSLIEEAARRGPGVAIASTVVILCVRPPHYACLWAGDSRAYCFSGGAFYRVTRDHSLVQELVDAGVIDAHETESHPQANVITRAVGAGDAETFALDKAIDVLRPGDRLLLCSDGLTKTMTEDDIVAVLRDGGEDAAKRLVEEAVARQANDNVTAVVLDVLDGEDRDPDQAFIEA
jgi:protein phosphatase/serine/threonine-protein phosphatase Stp1